MIQMIMRTLVFLLLATCSTGGYAAQCVSGGGSPCEISIEDNLPSGKSFQLTLDVELLGMDGLEAESATGYWGHSGKLPKTHIKRLQLSLDGKKVYIPRKVISDMGNVFHASMKENEHAVVMLIKGGSGPDAFYATYVIIDDVLRKRTVRSNEAPEQYWEKTTFKSPVPAQTI